MGTKFATSTRLSDRILAMFRADDWPDLPAHTREWLHLQRRVSRLPERDRLLVESFPMTDANMWWPMVSRVATRSRPSAS